MRTLYICLALAFGEFVATGIPNWDEAWPVAAILAVLVALFGYGYAVRGWHLFAVFFVGVALFLSAAGENERLYREKPWLRGRNYVSRPVEDGCAASVRRELSRRVAIGLEGDPEIVGLNRAILLGERAYLPKRTKKVFVESGTMHVFAISGLHVMAVARVLIVILSVLCVPRRWTGGVAIPILWFYVWVIGCAPSAVRAAIMATFYYSAPLFWRKPNGLRSWALAFLIVHIANPLMIDNVGNALSFAVMLAIVLFGEFGSCCGLGRSGLGVTCAAWAAGVPIAAHVFGRVTPGGLLANLVLIGMAGYTVMSGAIGLAVSFVSTTAAAHLNNLCALFTRSMVGISEAVARLPFANFEVGTWSVFQCGDWYAMLVLIAALVRMVRSRRTV